MELIQQLLLFPVCVWVVYGTGVAAWKLVRLPQTTPFAAAWLQLSFGFAVLSLLIFFLGAFHWFTRPVIGIIGALLSVPAFFELFKSAPAQSLRNWIGRFRKAPALTLVILTVLVVAFGGACSPEVRGDAIIYHIAQAQLFMLNRGHVDIPSSALTYIPQYQHTLYALGLLLGGDCLAKFMHYTAGLLLLLGTACFARENGGNYRRAAAAVALLAMFPVYTYLATSCYVDLAAANYTLAALFVVVCLPRKSFRALVAGGFFMGMALGTKYTAIVVGLVPLSCVVLIRDAAFEQSWKPLRAIKQASVFCTAAVVTFLPWLLRNWTYTGNPIAPNMMRQLGPPGVPESTLIWPDIQPGDLSLLSRPLELLRAYFDMYLAFDDYGNYLPHFAVVLGCGCLLTKQKIISPLVILLLVFLAVSYIPGVPTATVRRDSRYVMAHMGIVAVLVVSWYHALQTNLREKAILLRWANAGVFTLLFLTYATQTRTWFFDLREDLFPPLSKEQRDAYLRTRLEGYVLNTQLDETVIRSDKKVLGSYYPARVHYVMPGAPLKAGYVNLSSKSITLEHIPWLKSEGIGWILGEVQPEVMPFLQLRGEVSGTPVYQVR